MEIKDLIRNITYNIQEKCDLFNWELNKLFFGTSGK